MDHHKQKPWHTQPLTEVYQTLRTSEEGLSDAEAAERLRKMGATSCAPNRQKPFYRC